MTSRTIAFDELASADLVVDAVYEGGRAGTAGDDPLAKLLPVGKQGGFRYRGSVTPFAVQMVVLFTSGHDPDWHTGRFVYFGDKIESIPKPVRALDRHPRVIS